MAAKANTHRPSIHAVQLGVGVQGVGPMGCKPHLEIEFQRRQGIASCGMWCTTPFHASVCSNAVQKNTWDRWSIDVWNIFLQMRYVFSVIDLY